MSDVKGIKMVQLSKNFNLAEMIRSGVATNRGLDNTPSQTVIDDLRRLCENVLQPIRDHYGKPVNVSSGYRSPAVNKAVGGTATSQHVLGQAADISVEGVGTKELWEFIRDNLDYDQNILEYYKGGRTGWVHVSWRQSRRRKSSFKIG